MLREEGEVGREGLRVGEQDIGVVEALIEDLEIVEKKKKKRSRDKGTGKYISKEKKKTEIALEAVARLEEQLAAVKEELEREKEVNAQIEEAVTPFEFFLFSHK